MPTRGEVLEQIKRQNTKKIVIYYAEILDLPLTQGLVFLL
jgi:hypothetical protein